MKNYIKPIMNISEFDFENVLTGSSVEPQPETVAANTLIDDLLKEKNYKETLSFTF